MFSVGVVEVAIMFLVGPIVALVALYYVVRLAVRDGNLDAVRKADADRVRNELGLGPERSPNSRG